MSQSNALFIPLRAEHFEAFDRREKTDEYRPYGPRWNESTCRPGREAILSYGYGMKRRIKAIIRKATVVPATEAFLKIYGPDRLCYAISLVELENI